LLSAEFIQVMHLGLDTLFLLFTLNKGFKLGSSTDCLYNSVYCSNTSGFSWHYFFWISRFVTKERSRPHSAYTSF